MRNCIRTVAMAAAPVWAVCASIFTMRAAGLSFPLEMAVTAWPDWLVFSALVLMYDASLRYVARLLPESPADERTDRRPPTP